jgi:hypothetical protein
MGLQESNQEICQRMEQFVKTAPLSDKILRVGSDYADAAREAGATNDPGWFAANRASIASNLKGNVLTIIMAMREIATYKGVPLPQAAQHYLKPTEPVGSEGWRRGVVRRHLLRHALRSALSGPGGLSPS